MRTVEREFDLVIFGASGFTGKYVVEYVVNLSEEEKDLKWAVAGRSKKKVEKVLREIALITGKDLTNVEIISADVADELSLAKMCSRTKIVLNCVGPFITYGEPVVKASIENGSHHIDISGESLFAGSMQLKYHEAAQKAKVYVIGTAGFDSVASETGIQYLQEKFSGDVCSVEVMYKMNLGPAKFSGNIGSLRSVILHLTNERNLQQLHSKLFSNPIPKGKYPLKSRGLVSYCKEIKKWCITFPNSDVDVVNRTQYNNYHTRHMKPVEMKSYVLLPGHYFIALAFALVMKLFMAICKSKLGGFLLKIFPSLMTAGVFSNTGPTRKQIQEASFDLYIIGHGHKEKLAELNDQHSQPPDKKMIVKVHGPELGYAATPIFMVQTALVILQEKKKLPDEGGVFTPGTAFCHTTLIDRLIKNGVTYEVTAH